jgi:TolB protein
VSGLAIGATGGPDTLRDFGPLELFAPGIASTRYSEVHLTLSPGGKTALWFTRDRPGGPGGYDIWMSRHDGSGWSAATPVSFNSPQRDFDPAFTADGRDVYFCSDRPGGWGGDDLYRVAVTPDGFGKPELLDDAVNSAGNEWAPMLSKQNILLYSSNGRGGQGGFDLFISGPPKLGRFPAARAVPGEINTDADEFDATFLDDSRIIIFSRAPDLDKDTVWLYAAVRGGGAYDTGVKLPEAINLSDKSSFAPMIDWSRTGRITFTRAGDLYLLRLRVDSR